MRVRGVQEGDHTMTADELDLLRQRVYAAAEATIAFILDRAEQLNATSGSRVFADELIDGIAEGRHIQCLEAGEYDDLRERVAKIIASHRVLAYVGLHPFDACVECGQRHRRAPMRDTAGGRAYLKTNPGQPVNPNAYETALDLVDEQTREIDRLRKLYDDLLKSRGDGTKLAFEMADRAKAELAHAVSENLAFNIKVASEINEARAQRDAALKVVHAAEKLIEGYRSIDDMDRYGYTLTDDLDHLRQTLEEFRRG